MLLRAHTKKVSDVRQHDEKEKICKQILLLQLKATAPIFSHLLFLLVFVTAAKNVAIMLPSNKGKFFVYEIFLKKPF